MPDTDALNAQEVHVPPSADPHLASKYVDWLVELLNKDKIEVNHSDLKKFEINSLEDHYRVDLKQYDVEVSHSKHPKTGEDIYTMIFNNLTQLSENNQLARVILAYVHLTREQFERFKNAADIQINRKIREAEEKRFREAMEPIDDLLDKIASGDEEAKEEQPQVSTFMDQAADSTAPLPQPMELPPVPQQAEPVDTSTSSVDTSAPQPMDLPPVPENNPTALDNSSQDPVSSNPYLSA